MKQARRRENKDGIEIVPKPISAWLIAMKKEAWFSVNAWGKHGLCESLRLNPTRSN